MAIDVLNDISRYIPKQIDVELTSVIIGADSVLISGDTGGFDAVDDVKNSLENAVLFKNVSITSTNKDRSGNRVRFKIKADYLMQWFKPIAMKLNRRERVAVLAGIGFSAFLWWSDSRYFPSWNARTD